MSTPEIFTTFDDSNLDTIQEEFDCSWELGSTPYQPEPFKQTTRAQQEKFAREVLYRTTGIHDYAQQDVA